MEKYGFSLSIPPGALEEGSGPMEICLEVLERMPNDLVLQEDELLASLGFQCTPAGLTFKKPVEVTIPHCAILTDVRRVKGVLYTKAEKAPGK